MRRWLFRFEMMFVAAVLLVGYVQMGVSMWQWVSGLF